MTAATPDRPDELTEVQTILTRPGLGLLAGEVGLRQLPGRNRNWICTTDTGTRVFVKKLQGPAEASAARVRQYLAFGKVLAKAEPAALSAPRLLGADPEAGVLVFTCVGGGRTGAEVWRDGGFTPELAYSLGHTVALLHSLPADDLLCDPATNPLLPSEELLEAVPLALFESSSAGELQVWALLQNDTELAVALHRPVGIAAGAPPRTRGAAPAPPTTGTMRQITCTSGDGTPVRITVLAPRDAPDGPRPAILYVYGGFGLSCKPLFRPEVAVWVEAGGVYAAAHVRGGGEEGADWHRGRCRGRQTEVRRRPPRRRRAPLP